MVKENNPVESKDRIHKNSCDIACSLRRDVIQGIQFVRATVPPHFAVSCLVLPKPS